LDFSIRARDSAPAMAGNGGCADGVLVLLGIVQPFGRPRQEKRQEFPLLCKITSLLDPEDLADTSSDPFMISKYVQPPEQGDLVVLGSGSGVPLDFQLCTAVVTEVNPACCTVAVLDPSGSFMVDACKASLDDISPLHSDWRLGNRLVLGGFKKTLAHLNGLSAIVCQHKRHGHPCFLQKPGSPEDALHLMICVHVSGKSDTGKVLLLEPKQLSPALPHVEKTAFADMSISKSLAVDVDDIVENEDEVAERKYFQEPHCPLLATKPAASDANVHDQWSLWSRRLTSIFPVTDCSTCCTKRPLMPILEDIPSTPMPNSFTSQVVGTPEPGDLVILSRNVQPDFHLCWAVVKAVATGSCEVAVLDGTRSFEVASCELKTEHVTPVSHEWRVGTRLVINSLESTEVRHLNGRIGVVHPHKRHGHPCFLARPGSSKMHLSICLRLEADATSAILLEPRFLSPYKANTESQRPSDACRQGPVPGRRPSEQPSQGRL